MKTRHRITRRSFLSRSGAAVAGAIAAPTIIPASARGADGTTAPSNRITMGCIGVGGRGTSNMGSFLRYDDMQVIAVCDVDRNNRDAAARQIERRYGRGAGVARYNDFRELIARDDIDSLSIATPDHWHALTAIAGAKAGKDIYCEKPLSLTIAQGRAMSDTVRRYGIVFAAGSQQRSDNNFRFACELVRNERIGKLVRVKAGLPGGSACAPQQPIPVPDHLDYEMWLGPAPERPYTNKQTHWDFRWILDYSGGQLTDWGAHHCDIAQWGMGTDRSGPREIEGSGDYPRDGLWNAATSYSFDCLYESGVVMTVSSQVRGGVTFEGTDGWVWVNRGHIEAEPANLLSTVIGPGEIHLYDSRAHHRNFVECVKTRREPIAPVEVAHRSISISHLGNIAMQLGRKVYWDPERERFERGDAEANRALSRAMRGPWQV